MDYCKTNNLNDLNHSIAIKTINYDIATPKTYMRDFDPNFLNYEKIPWKLEWSEITLYDDNNKFINSTIDNIDLIKSTDFDVDWFNTHNKYILSFTIRDYLTVYSYTTKYFSLINKYLRKENWKQELETLITDKSLFFIFYYQLVDMLQKDFDNDIIDLHGSIINIKNINKNNYNLETYNAILDILPNIKYELIEILMNNYIIELIRLVYNAPYTTKEIILWRGVKNDKFIKDVKNNYFISKNIMSCSLDFTVHEEFRNDNCCIKCIILPRRYRCFYLGNCSSLKDEHEILFAHNSAFKIYEPIQKTITYRPYNSISTITPHNFICDIITHNVKITKMEFIGYIST